VNDVPLGHCAACASAIDPSGPAVQAPPRARWEPYLEDVRSSGSQFLHVECFLRKHGAEALVEAVKREDDRRTGRLTDAG
jgi:hypothetical protein